MSSHLCQLLCLEWCLYFEHIVPYHYDTCHLILVVVSLKSTFKISENVMHVLLLLLNPLECINVQLYVYIELLVRYLLILYTISRVKVLIVVGSGYLQVLDFKNKLPNNPLQFMT